MCRTCDAIGLRPEDIPAGSLVETYIDPTGRSITYVNGKRWKRQR